MTPNHRLKRARELKGWSQSNVAQYLDTDTTTVSRWERGLFVPAPAFREKLCALFERNAEDLGLLAQPVSYSHRVEHQETDFPLSSFLRETEHLRSLSNAPLPVPCAPSSWENQVETYAYIVQSAAYDQQAYRLWREAYVQFLAGHYTHARSLGEAGLQAFERIGHPSARFLRAWLTQEALLPSPSSPISAEDQREPEKVL